MSTTKKTSFTHVRTGIKLAVLNTGLRNLKIEEINR